MSVERRKADTELIQEFFKNLSFLKNLSEAHVAQLIKDFSVLKAGRGDIVFHQADPSTDLYIVIKGKVRASLLNVEGQELVLADFRKGDFFGEMSLLDGRPRSATIIAVDDSVLAVLKREKFLQAVKRDPMIAIELLSALVHRLRVTDDMMESIAFLDVGQRLLRLFQRMAETETVSIKDGFLAIEKLTHKELAARTGSSREAVSKAMKVLSFRNIVKEGDGCLLISGDAGQHFTK